MNLRVQTFLGKFAWTYFAAAVVQIAVLFFIMLLFIISMIFLN